MSQEWFVLGVTEEEAKSFFDSIRCKMAAIMGAGGRGGSGLFVRLEDGSLAVLTARHVVVGCVLTGELTLLRLGESDARTSVGPRAILVDGRHDAALLVVDEKDFPGPSLAFEEWTTLADQMSQGAQVVVSGVVGEWKDPQPEKCVIPRTVVLHYWTVVESDVLRGGLLPCHVDETQDVLPSSFGGMSGGPAITPGGTFVGVNAEEVRRVGGVDGEIRITPASALVDLYTPFSPGPDAPADYMRQKAFFKATVVEKRTGIERRIRVYVEYFWSSSDPAHQYGRFGMINGVEFQSLNGDWDYPMKTTARFRWYDGDTDEDRFEAFREELSFLLEDTGFFFSRGGEGI